MSETAKPLTAAQRAAATQQKLKDAKAKLAAKGKTSVDNTPAKEYAAVVATVGEEVFTKSNGSQFRVCSCIVTVGNKEFTVDAFRTILKTHDAEGNELAEPVESRMPEEGDEVKLYGRTIIDKRGVKTAVFDISIGTTNENSSDDLLAAMAE